LTKGSTTRVVPGGDLLICPLGAGPPLLVDSRVMLGVLTSIR
jgi:hypothetical protein